MSCHRFSRGAPGPLKALALGSLTALSLAYALVAAPLAAQTATQPPSAGSDARDVELQTEGLLADVRRVIAAEESLGWVIDEVELSDTYPTLLRSVCRTLPAARAAALERLRAESAALGDPKALYLQSGHELTSEVESALTAKRRLLAFEHATVGASRDCPFWLEIDPSFEGLQTDRNRFTLNVESGGVAILRETAGDWTLGAGGYGRVLPAYGFGGSWSLLGGGEFGGGALLRAGDETTGLVVNYFTALPLVARLRDVAWHYDFELAPVALFETDDTDISWGGRVGVAVGINALYTTGFIPWAGVSMAYEYYVESGGRPDAHFIRGGFKAGISWDP